MMSNLKEHEYVTVVTALVHSNLWEFYEVSIMTQTEFSGGID